MTACTPVPAGPGVLPAGGCCPATREWFPAPVPGGALLALATSLRARGLRGLDLLRRSEDRAPPPSS
jgi:hypothetical protein